MTTSISSNTTYGSLNFNGTEAVKFNADGLPPNRNVLINATFQINNGNAGTAYVSAAALSVGQYGHEMWKAGASGGDYSFTQNAAITTITIASGKSLIQVIEDKNIEGGSYILTWEGTAQARVGINSATPSGSYAASPLVVSGQTAGTVMSVEFNTGTLSKAQLEAGILSSKFEFRQDELERTQRYCQIISGGLTSDEATAAGGSFSKAYIVPHIVKMRVTPTVTNSSFGSVGGVTSAVIVPVNIYSTNISAVWPASTAVSSKYFTATGTLLARL